MGPDEIFRLIVKADDAVKYARADTLAVRVDRARRLLLQARQEAQAIGNDALVHLADQRLADLESLQ
jgi:hypothetical protein